MKKIVLFIELLLLTFVLNAQTTAEKKVRWDYPVKPGTAEWKACNSPKEIYAALQIPENTLKRIDTESLVQICLDYPATTIFHIFDTPQQGFDGFYKQFNGIQTTHSLESGQLVDFDIQYVYKQAKTLAYE